MKNSKSDRFLKEKPKAVKILKVSRDHLRCLEKVMLKAFFKAGQWSVGEGVKINVKFPNSFWLT